LSNLVYIVDIVLICIIDRYVAIFHAKINELVLINIILTF